MADVLDDILVGASDLLSVIGWFWPPAAIIGKIVGYAADAEPEAVNLIDMWRKHVASGGTLTQEHVDQATSTVNVIEQRFHR